MWPDVVSIALNQKENLSEEEQRKDMLYLLEAKRLILDERNGPGSFRDFYPWKVIIISVVVSTC